METDTKVTTLMIGRKDRASRLIVMERSIRGVGSRI